MIFNKLILLVYLVVLINHASGQIRKFRPATPPKLAPFGSGLGTTRTLKAFGPQNVFKDKVTLSGLSSGGTFAQQMQFSYSSMFSGIAVFSHTYYRCGPPNGIQADYDNVCTTLGNLPNDQLYDYRKALDDIRQYYSRNLIEDPQNLQTKKLYVYTGTNNFLFTTDQSLRIVDIYEPFIKNPKQIFTRVQSANVTLPSETFGGPCSADAMSTFFVSNCNLNGPFEALKFLIGDEIKKPSRGSIQLEPLEEFDQAEFSSNVTGRSDMDAVGYYYIPRKCQNGRKKCLLHFYFHGCLSGREFVLANHIKSSGYLELAETNGIIIVFPQARSSPENDIGCWDTYGVTGREYATQRGPQVSVVRNMLGKILSGGRQNSHSHSGSSHSGNYGNNNNGGRGYDSRQRVTDPNLDNPYFSTYATSSASSVRLPPMRNRNNYYSGSRAF